MAEKILEVVNLGTRFKTERGVLKAIDGVSFDVYRGEMLGIVGESGCGKSVTSQSILRLYDEKRLAVYSGEVRFEGKNLFDAKEIRQTVVRFLIVQSRPCTFIKTLRTEIDYERLRSDQGPENHPRF